MVTGPVLALLVYDLIIFLAAISQNKDAGQRRQTLLLCGLFFCSGMPALVYQIVWQRALFAIYGVNAESVAVVVRMIKQERRYPLVIFPSASVQGSASLSLSQWE